MADLTRTLYRQMEESEKLDVVIRENLEALGYGGEDHGENNRTG